MDFRVIWIACKTWILGVIGAIMFGFGMTLMVSDRTQDLIWGAGLLLAIVGGCFGIRTICYVDNIKAEWEGYKVGRVIAGIGIIFSIILGCFIFFINLAI